MLAVTRRIVEGDRLLRDKVPWRFAPKFMLGAGLSGHRLGVVGFGRIGRAVAARAAAFGMEIVYSSPREATDATGATRLSQRDLLRTADIVTLHCRLSPDTIHLIDSAALRLMKPTAYLINAARGPIVDEPALVEALRTGKIAGAALDVFEHEPDVHPGLLELDSVVLTPHIGSAVGEVRAAMASLAAANIMAVLSGEAPLTPIAGV
jgi:lactate dehydrogenase-like 2-hydroxyacid dehydrogenase